MKRERLLELLTEKKKRLGINSLYFFTKYILQRNLLQPQPHWEMCGFLEKYPRTDKLMLCPRGTFKSTITTVAYPLWRLLREPNLRILIVTAELENARSFLTQVRQQVEGNEEFRKLYGEWDSRKNEVMWTSSALTFSCRTDFSISSPSITCISYKVSKVSQHYDLVILDDIQVEKNVATVEAIDQVEEYVKLLIPLIDPDQKTGRRGPIIWVGTRWHLDDIYGRKLAQIEKLRKEAIRARKGTTGRAEYPIRTMVTSAIDPRTNKLFFPKRITRQFLKSLIDEGHMTRYQVSCQYMNDPLPEEDQVFRVRDFRFWNARGMQPKEGTKLERLPEYVNTYMTLDPSMGEHADSDYSAFIVVNVDPQWRILLQEVVREHYGPEAIIETLFDLATKWKPQRTGIEAVIFQKAFVHFFKRYAREHGKWFHVVELNPEHKVKKDLRIRGLAPFVADNYLYFQVSDDMTLTESQEELFHNIVDGQDMLAREMVHFPLAKTKDCVDALAYVPQIMLPGSVPKKSDEAKPRTFQWFRRKIREQAMMKRGRIGEMLRY